MSDTIQTEENAEPTYTYRVVRGCVRIPRSGKRKFSTRSDFISQNELIPDGMFGDDDISSWLADGRISKVSLSPEQTLEARERNKTRGKWTVNPAALAGKDMEALLLMVIEIDEEYDTGELEDEGAVIRLLTSDWDSRYTETVAASTDRSEPVNFTNLEQTEVDTATHDVLQSARTKAAAPEQE